MGERSEPENGEAAAMPGVFEIKARPYQREMMEESLKRNIIVAMDTGSGKTHVSVMRMIHELERMPSHQFIWFLAPTVSLCEQQYEVIKSQISAVDVKILSGADGVDRWTEKFMWDAVLLNVKIMISTYQILLDALTHGFVKIESLGLIVFDEAHNCVGKSAGSKIMQTYHTQKAKKKCIPHILGLTASPVMRSDPKSVENIEKTLDSICRTPKHHRSDLIQHVKRPKLSEVRFQGQSPEVVQGCTQSVRSLGKAYGSLNLNEDPYVISLRKDTSDKGQRTLTKVYLNHKTWCSKQMKDFHGTATKIYEELGASSADYYVSEVVRKFGNASSNTGISWDSEWDVSAEEKRYISRALGAVEIVQNSLDPSSSTPPSISNKVRKLMDVLLQEHASFRGIIFVQERDVVAVLAYLLSIHPETRGRFQIGTMAGTSSHTKRSRDIAEFMGASSQNDTLGDFRAGKLNLVLATSVLEEGIDVPECNIVICFQKPANLKSFVQRRGRARKENSKLILLLEDDTSDKMKSATEWHQLEENMNQIYENDMRILQEFRAIEDSEEHDGRFFRVDKTGAVLDLDNAVPHLHHFCATLPANQYLDRRPEFICEDTGSNSTRAKVILPLSVDVSVRFANSQKSWISEKNAIKDVAFEAYVALYKKGLVNDHLLPLFRHGLDVGDLLTTKVETRASTVSVEAQINPWRDLARLWRDGDQISCTSLALSTTDGEPFEILILSPVPLPPIEQFKLFWDNSTEFNVKVKDTWLPGNKQKAEHETWVLLNAAFGHRFVIEKKQLPLLFSTAEAISVDQLTGNKIKITSKERFNLDPAKFGLVSDSSDPNIKYVVKSFEPNKPPIEDVQHPYSGYENAPNVPHISATRLPRSSLAILRFLRKADGELTKKPHSSMIPASRCVVEDMPFRYVQFGLFIPSIMHQLSSSLIAQSLNSTLLAPIQINNLALVTIAISAPSSGAPQNYERFEFLGDSLLKLCSSIQLMAEFPLWPEGYLSGKKDRLIANSRLSRSAIDLGLAKFIITSNASGHHWRPPYVEDLLAVSKETKRELSTKVLADCVEALIGASMLDGGIPSALKSMQIFLPELTWHPLEARRQTLFSLIPTSILPPPLLPLETLLGYKFQKPSVLCEAITHASFSQSGPTGTPIHSLERLEFLGDAILDHLLVDEMYEFDLTHFQMHDLQSAMGNADFLAWCCMQLHSVSVTASLKPQSLSPIYSQNPIPLWKFLRFSGAEMAGIMKTTASRYEILKPRILEAIERGERYPWTLLARLGAKKFYSDMVESLLGGLWVDSGAMDAGKVFLGKLGIMRYLREILKTVTSDGRGGRKVGTMLLSPKNELGILAGSERVSYKVFKNESTGKDNEGDDGKLGGQSFRHDDGIEGHTSCSVDVGGERIATYHGAVDKKEAEFGAADLAIKILQERKRAEKLGRKRKDGSEHTRRDAVGDIVMREAENEIED